MAVKKPMKPPFVCVLASSEIAFAKPSNESPFANFSREILAPFNAFAVSPFSTLNKMWLMLMSFLVLS